MAPPRRLALLIIAAIGCGCGTARVHRAHVRNAAERAGALAAARVPGPITEMVLDRHGQAGPLGLVQPGAAAARLVEAGADRNDPDGSIAVADLKARQARRAEVFAPANAPGLYLDAVEAASGYLGALPAPPVEPDAVADPREPEARRIYNEAVAGFLRATGGSWMHLDADWRAGLARKGIAVEVGGGPGAWDPEQFDTFYFAEDYKVFGIRDPKHADGLGVPLIAEHRAPPFAAKEPKPEGEQGFYPAQLRAYPATALLRVRRAAPGASERVVTLELRDPMRESVVAFAGGARPLRNDLTTPLSFYFTRLPLLQITRAGLLRPGSLAEETGLYLLHPYERGKIPVVLIHGLYSSPDTWHQALNELRGDPELRARYQFWVYFYPTGDPFVYSSAGLRASLIQVRQALDPNHADPAFDRMVLVGHSMGGLLSRMMAIDSGTDFWDGIANRPFSELAAGPNQKQFLANSYFFHAVPTIRRVIFIATPHRGSTLSQRLIGRATTALIQLPKVFGEVQHELRANNDPDFFKSRQATRPDTSIQQLSPRSPALAALNARPFAPGIPYHSIIAQTSPGPAEAGSDLVVRYDSAHLDGAESELIVPGTHSCLGSPDTIDEIARILRLHLADQGGTPAAAAAP